MTGRPCVVTIEGTAKPLEHDPTKVRVTSTSGVFVLDAGAMDVRLEYLAPGHDWQDGDVVAGTGTTVLNRVGGRWHQVTEHGVSTTGDGQVDQLVEAGTLVVLRYQGKRVA